MLSSVRCKVQTHYGQVLASNTWQRREQYENFFHSHYFFFIKYEVLFLLLEKKETTGSRFYFNFKNKQVSAPTSTYLRTFFFSF